MKIFKAFAALALVVVISLSVIACGGSKPTNTSQAASTSASSTSTASSTQESTSASSSAASSEISYSQPGTGPNPNEVRPGGESVDTFPSEYTIGKTKVKYHKQGLDGLRGHTQEEYNQNRTEVEVTIKASIENSAVDAIESIDVYIFPEDRPDGFKIIMIMSDGKEHTYLGGGL